MHELSLLENVRETLENYARQQDFTRITQVTLEIGRFSTVEPDALRFGFDVVMKDSLAEKAELVIEELNGLGFCRQCQQQVSLETLYDPCGHCGNPCVEVIQGAEMRIKELLVV